jgi:hypothetical protein
MRRKKKKRRQTHENYHFQEKGLTDDLLVGSIQVIVVKDTYLSKGKKMK